MQIGRGGRGLMYRFIAAVSIIVIEGGVFAHAKYRRKRRPLYSLFFFFFFPSMADQRFRGIPPIRWYRHRRVTTENSRANKFPFIFPFLLSRAFRKEKDCNGRWGEGETDFRSWIGIGIKESVILRSTLMAENTEMQRSEVVFLWSLWFGRMVCVVLKLSWRIVCPVLEARRKLDKF